MNLFDSHKGQILEEWRESILADYAGESRTCLKSNPDRFGNPVGRIIALATQEVLDFLFSDNKGDFAGEALDELMRIRAVQEFSPSQAVGIIGGLKSVLLRNLWESSRSKDEGVAFIDLLVRADQVQMLAFDRYSAHREVLAQIRIDEFRRRFRRIPDNSIQTAEFESTVGISNITIQQRQTTNGASL